MTWRNRVRDEVQAIIIDWWEAGDDHREITQDEIIKLACDIADALPSPDERNGYAIVPTEATTAQVISALETSLKIMTENGVDGLSPFQDYPNPAETTRRVYREMVKTASAKPFVDR